MTNICFTLIAHLFYWKGFLLQEIFCYQSNLLVFLSKCSFADLFVSSSLSPFFVNHSLSFLSFSRRIAMTTAPSIGWVTELRRKFASYHANRYHMWYHVISCDIMIEHGYSSKFQTSSRIHMLNFVAMLISGICKSRHQIHGAILWS